jgi:hypothetical protein
MDFLYDIDVQRGRGATPFLYEKSPPPSSRLDSAMRNDSLPLLFSLIFDGDRYPPAIVPMLMPWSSVPVARLCAFHGRVAAFALLSFSFNVIAGAQKILGLA